MFWKGKVFDPERGELRNRITPFDLHVVAAKVYRGDSWLDQKECIVLDYSETSLIAHWIRDEIREVADGLYLGVAFWRRTRIMYFSLGTEPSEQGTAPRRASATNPIRPIPPLP